MASTTASAFDRAGAVMPTQSVAGRARSPSDALGFGAAMSDALGAMRAEPGASRGQDEDAQAHRGNAARSRGRVPSAGGKSMPDAAARRVAQDDRAVAGRAAQDAVDRRADATTVADAARADADAAAAGNGSAAGDAATDAAADAQAGSADATDSGASGAAGPGTVEAASIPMDAAPAQPVAPTMQAEGLADAASAIAGGALQDAAGASAQGSTNAPGAALPTGSVPTDSLVAAAQGPAAPAAIATFAGLAADPGATAPLVAGTLARAAGGSDASPLPFLDPGPGGAGRPGSGLPVADAMGVLERGLAAYAGVTPTEVGDGTAVPMLDALPAAAQTALDAVIADGSSEARESQLARADTSPAARVDGSTAAASAEARPAVGARSTMLGELFARLQPDGMPEQMSQRVLWMQQVGVQLARLQVHPAELGPIDIALDQRDGSIAVTMTAQHPATRELLESHLQRMREQLAQDGARVDRFDVLGGDAGSGGDRDARDGNAGGGAASGQGDGPDRADAGPAIVLPMRSANLFEAFA